MKARAPREPAAATRPCRLCSQMPPLRTPCTGSLPDCARRFPTLRTPCTGSFSDCAHIDSHRHHIAPACPLVLAPLSRCFPPHLGLAPPAYCCPLLSTHSLPCCRLSFPTAPICLSCSLRRCPPGRCSPCQPLLRHCQRAPWSPILCQHAPPRGTLPICLQDCQINDLARHGCPGARAPPRLHRLPVKRSGQVYLDLDSGIHRLLGHVCRDSRPALLSDYRAMQCQRSGPCSLALAGTAATALLIARCGARQPRALRRSMTRSRCDQIRSDTLVPVVVGLVPVGNSYYRIEPVHSKATPMR